MSGSGEQQNSGLTLFLRQIKRLFWQKIGRKQRTNSGSSIQTAVLMEDESKEQQSFSGEQERIMERNLKTAFAISLCCTLIYFCVWIVMIVVGASNMGYCPADSRIPIWMIIYGSIGMVVGIVSTYIRFPGLWSLLLILSCIGAAWVYPIFGHVQHVDIGRLYYCTQSVFMLSFIVITIDLVLFTLLIICFFILLCWSIYI